ncbi:CPBP family intramembrane metalloprotease [Cryobacterium glaciale]|uniref:CPBP family intramembrane metalloprotease n=1 Tax=Cryobacterium glaciale TaxID=1259145 RepID=A0A4R8UX84_9MICO|nr:CPBP family intramembrane metalloprotease [Cryobacterium glaciale]
MIGVGFVEELIFRGFLFQAILAKKTVLRAIYLSGITFGLGHIVNLLRGYSGFDQLIQLVAAIVIGIALGYVVAITRSILPVVLFHILFNISGALTTHDVVWERPRSAPSSPSTMPSALVSRAGPRARSASVFDVGRRMRASSIPAITSPPRSSNAEASPSGEQTTLAQTCIP